MTDLERRALLGDKQAQEELTRQGVMLPCPLCKEKVRYYFVEKHEEGKKGAVIVVPDMSYVECKCGYSVQGVGKKMAIKKHNARPAPPIGRCKDCEKWAGKQGDTRAMCSHCGGKTGCDDSCNHFEPRHPDAT